MTPLTDDEFIAAFEDATLPNGSFHHRDHLRLAWLYLDRAPYDRALARIERSIRRFAAAHGAAQKYHHTLTILWMRLVAAHRRDTPHVTRFEAFLDLNPGLLDKALPWRHYSDARLMSEPARAGWIEPDLAPLPGGVDPRVQVLDSQPLGRETNTDKPRRESATNPAGSVG